MNIFAGILFSVNSLCLPIAAGALATALEMNDAIATLMVVGFLGLFISNCIYIIFSIKERIDP